MRFGLVHRMLTDALAALGILAVVSTASLSPWVNVLLVVALAVAIVVPERWQGRPALRQFAAIAPLVLLVVQIARILAGRSPLDVAVEFAAILQIIRVATRRGAAHDPQIIVLALLHFVAGTVLGGGLTYGLCFLGFLIIAPGALVLSHLRREVEGNYRQGARDRTGLPVDVPRILRSRRVVGRGFLMATCLLSVPILLFTAILFVLFPRIGLSLLLLQHPHAGRMIGFSEHVDLGDVGVLRDDPTIALRFQLPGQPSPPPTRVTLRLRGTAFDTYDGHAWSRSHHEEQPADRSGAPEGTYPLVRLPDPARDAVVSFDLEPIDPPVLFLPPRAVALRTRLPSSLLLAAPLVVERAAEGEVRYATADPRGLRYDVYVAPDGEPLVDVLSATDRPRYLTLPAGLPRRIAGLAHRWTDGLASPAAKARAIEQHLRHDFGYDLRSPSQGQPQPVDHFLFVSRRGHCEFFSTAMALMLREVDIPSRNVTGFVGGIWNRFGSYYAVREGDAHSWVEAYIDDPTHPGWRTFDPTPSSGDQPLGAPSGAYYWVRDFVEALSQRWDTYVVGYDLRKQLRMLDEVGRHYDRLRTRAGANHGPLAKLTRGPVLACAALLALAATYALWKRRRRDRAPSSPGPAGAVDARAQSAAALYRSLETALHLRGITRAPSTTPLRHAEDLQAQDHPLAPEVLSLTTVYLQARFGGAVLTASTRRDFERRVRDIRTFRAPEPSS